MKKSLLPKVSVSASSYDEFLHDIRTQISDKNFEDKYIKTTYGVTPVLDTYTNNVVGYDTLGDPTAAKQEDVEYEIFGTKVVLPVITSKYKMATEGGEKEDTIKSLNYGEDQLEMVNRSIANCGKILLFASQYLENVLRGMTPELRDLDVNGGQLPLFGKLYLDLLTSAPVPGMKADTLKRIKSIADSIQLYNAMYRAMLDNKIAIHETMADIISKHGILKSDITDNVSNVAYTPVVNGPSYNVVNATNVESVNNNSMNRVYNTMSANGKFPTK